MTEPVLASKNAAGKRVYVLGDREYTSVTDALQAVPKPFLVPWAAKMSAEYVRDNWDALGDLMLVDPDQAVRDIKGARFAPTEKAADLGTRVHDWAEQYALGNNPAVPDDMGGHAEQFAAWCDRFDPMVVLSEVTVFNHTYGYAGTFDAVWEFPSGRRLLVDIKTGKGVYPEVALQLAAYRGADIYVTDDGDRVKMIPVDGCAVLHLRPRGCKLIPVEAGKEQYNMFVHALKMRQYDQADHKVIGEPVIDPEDVEYV